MNKKIISKSALYLAALTVTVLIVSYVYGGSSLLSPGTSKISAGDSFDFTLNVKSLGGSESDEEEAVSEYVVNLSVSPAPASLSVKEGKGSINAVTGNYQVTSSELGGTDVLHFTLSTSSDLASETTYKVSVTVTGSVSDSDSFTLVVSPKQESSEGEQTDPSGGDEQGGDVPDGGDGQNKQNGDMPDGKGNGNVPGNMGKKGNISGSMPSASLSGSASSTSSVTYAGSWDNYLETLSVDGYDFTNKFNKIRDTYFITIPEDVTSVTVNADPSDSSANVAVTGNSDIPKGRSKILVSVTADDGSVRLYRIYVDRG